MAVAESLMRALAFLKRLLLSCNSTAESQDQHVGSAMRRRIRCDHGNMLRMEAKDNQMTISDVSLATSVKTDSSEKGKDQNSSPIVANTTATTNETETTAQEDQPTNN
eukprot:4015466-Ditylum_brightwellii.AAC.1